jgi:uncharacterized damage-inducible protein DinB
MTQQQQQILRQSIVALLSGGNAFTPVEKIVTGVPEHARGQRIEGFGHSLWDLLEHIRIDQREILDFCDADEYRELKWPEETWPASHEPPSTEAWDASVATFLAELERAKRQALDESIDLFATVRHATRPTQTWLRELLLIAEHNGHHLGQFIALRKMLGVWESKG